MMKNLALSALLLAGTAVVAGAQENPAPSREGGFGLGRAALPEEIAAWDIDVRPDGEGLPVGAGDVWTGEELFIDYCSACHGDFGEAVGRWPVLAGGFGSLDGEDPVKTIGSYWPYLSTVWDYVHRAMPYGAAQSLSDDEVYALVAYLMYVNNMVEDDFELSNENFLEVTMPNEDAFFMDDRVAAEFPLFSLEPCMENCAESVEITMRAAVLDVTPDTSVDDGASATQEATPAAAVEEATDVADADTSPAGPDPELVAAGERLFRQCSSCHEIGEGARSRTGPALNGIYNAAVASREGFRYSPALVGAGDAGMVWDDENLAGYLANPRGFIRGNRMAFAGFRAQEDVEAMIAYLQVAGAE
jgi:cytochrome c